MNLTIRIRNLLQEDIRGAMAQEVPQASLMSDEGYLMVDYSKIDVPFEEI